MTEQELEILRYKMQALAATVLLEWGAQQVRLYLAVALASDAEARQRMEQVLRSKLQKAQSDYAQIAFPELQAEWSDLHAAEFQEAFDEIAKRAVKALGIS